MINKIYTFSRLGTHGALGNQLWEIAGTIGKAYYGYGRARFPDWEYRPYFSVPDEHFLPVPEGAVDLYPDYLQDLGHFTVSTTYIHQIFQPSAKVSRALDEFGFENCGATGVHVRRANNLTLPDHHPVCPLDYYEAALDGLPRDNLWVFSDDLDWCRKQSLFEGARFGLGVPPGVNIFDLTGAKPLTTSHAAMDLHAISRCRNVIISNSTFSWWGAWLGGCKVKYPSRWFGPALKDIDTKVMFPTHWTEIPFEESWTKNS